MQCEMRLATYRTQCVYMYVYMCVRICVCVRAQEPTKYASMDTQRVTRHVEATFLFALTWSIGGTGATSEARGNFDAFLRKAVACAVPDYTGPSGEK